MSRFLVVHWIPKLLISLFWLHGSLQLRDVDGVLHSPLQLHEAKAAVLIFIGVDCPISNSYTPMLNQMMHDYAGQRVDFYMVYSDPNLPPADARRHSRDFGYLCPSLLDPDQKLMKKLHASVTPQAVVVDASGTTVYRGRIDNWYEDFGKQRFAPTTHDLKDAIDAVLAGKKVATAVTRAVGCPI
jgi:hypothetical protein